VLIAKTEQKGSRPTRARGLKLSEAHTPIVDGVAPHAGAWIETDVKVNNWIALSRAPRGRVD